MVSEVNIEFLRERNAQYIVSTSKRSDASLKKSCSKKKIGSKCARPSKSNCCRTGWKGR